VASILALLGGPRWVGGVGASLEPGEVGEVAVTSLPISAREIRERIRAGRSIQGMVPALVEEYIHKHRLYRDNLPPSA